MSAVSEAVARRMTLGYLADTYGLELDPDFASGVTVTSIADDVDSVAPGSLYVPAQSVDVKRLEEARARGAYAALVPPSMKHEDGPAQMPLLRARLTSRQLGDIASDIAGTPSNALAIFVVGSDDPKRSERYASCVADFLHMLGNPVGVISSSDSQSLERFLNLEYPLSAIDVQRTMAVCAEDGAAAVILALDEETLREDALQSVSVDVLACDDNGLSDAEVAKLVAKFGCAVGKQTRIAGRTQESDLLAAQAATAYGQTDSRSLSLSIAMVLAAGVRKANIKSALRVSRDLN